MTTNTPAPIPKRSLLTTGQILGLERRSNMTDDEALRFGRAIESVLLSKLRAPVADDWTPTPENINKLPEPVRAYIHALVANSDPSGMVAENTLLRDQTKQLDAMIGRLKQALNSVGGCFDAANCEGLLEALAETNDERLKDLVERRLMYANEYARAALASAPVAGEATKPRPPMLRIAGVSEDVLRRAATRNFTPPFGNCSFRMCDLPGQCRGEGKCHHPSDAAPQASEADPLQEAADWLMRAFDPPLSASDLARQLVIGYNRATRLRDAALSAQPGAQPKDGGHEN